MTQHHLRLPPKLHERLTAIAKEQGVSLNHAIELILTSATAGFEFNQRPDEPQKEADDA